MPLCEINSPWINTIQCYKAMINTIIDPLYQRNGPFLSGINKALATLGAFRAFSTPDSAIPFACILLLYPLIGLERL